MRALKSCSQSLYRKRSLWSQDRAGWFEKKQNKIFSSKIRSYLDTCVRDARIRIRKYSIKKYKLKKKTSSKSRFVSIMNNENPFTSAANSALWSLQGRNASNTANAENASPASIPNNIFTNPAIQPTSVVNLSNSSDVVIGPMTQYQGPVTIYQYMDATVEARSMQASGGINQTRNVNNTSITQKLTTTSKLLILLILLVVIVAGVVVYIEATRENKKPERGPILFSNNYEHGTFPNLGNGHLIVDRVQWGSSELAQNLSIPLTHPIPYVLITHIGVQSIPCENIYKCSIKMRTIQDSAIAEKHLPDIQSNFYVGNDGNIYVGRGWHFANTYANGTLAITFMGDYGRYIPSDYQFEATQFLLSHALTNKYVALDYKLVAQNQTKSSKSPGVNIFQRIKTWPHFYPCNMDGNPRCGVELGMSQIWDAKQ